MQLGGAQHLVELIGDEAEVAPEVADELTDPMLAALNIMHLKTPQSAILSAVIFNALIIVALIPLALRGVKYRAMGAAALLRNNLLIYGMGGIIIPFIGIKLIDMVITRIGMA